MRRFFTAFMRRLAGRRNDAAQGALVDGMPVDGMPAMLDCDSVMRQLWDYLDGELTVDRKSAIRSHLELCKRCHPQYQFEQSFLEAVAASAPRHSDPERLRAKLLMALEGEGLERA